MIDRTNESKHQEERGGLLNPAGRSHSLFQSSGNGMLVLDAVNQEITDANPFMIDLIGSLRADLLGKELWEIGLFKDQNESQSALRELMATGYLRFEAVLETKAGERREVEVIGVPSTKNDCQVIQCHIRDITERNRTEVRLHEQVALLDHAQRIGRMGNWSLDLRSGRLVWCDATCELFGITRAEFAETIEHFYSLVLAEDLPAYTVALSLVSPTDPLFEVEYRIQRPDGEVRWLFERGEIEFDMAGTPIGRIGIVMDITERHAVRERLAHNAGLLAQIAGKAARLGGWAIQLPERVLTWSDENCAIHDLPPGHAPTLEEGIGYFPPEHRAEVIRCVEACARDGTPYDFELPKYTASGRLIWVRSIGEAVRDASGAIVRVQGAFQDITLRKQAEAEREKLIKELQDALAEVKTLREFLPICSYCKKVRDDQNYWSQIESYISEHTSTKFSHSICPQCYELEVGPQLEEMKRRKAEQGPNGSSATRLSKD